MLYWWPAQLEIWNAHAHVHTQLITRLFRVYLLRNCWTLYISHASREPAGTLLGSQQFRANHLYKPCLCYSPSLFAYINRSMYDMCCMKHITFHRQIHSPFKCPIMFGVWHDSGRSSWMHVWLWAKKHIEISFPILQIASKCSVTRTHTLALENTECTWLSIHKDVPSVKTTRWT